MDRERRERKIEREQRRKEWEEERKTGEECCNSTIRRYPIVQLLHSRSSWSPTRGYLRALVDHLNEEVDDL